MTFVRRNIGYIVLALVMSAFVLAIAVLLPNSMLLTLVWTSGNMTVLGKVSVTLSLLGSLTTNFSPISAFTTIAISLLVGVNSALMLSIYRRQKRLVTRGSVATTSLGALFGMFSVGCAACGSLILMSFLGVVGGVGVLTLLPLRGQEIGILGVLILGYTTFLLTRTIIKPLICDIP
jgi:hypothetical protein